MYASWMYQTRVNVEVSGCVYRVHILDTVLYQIKLGGDNHFLLENVRLADIINWEMWQYSNE